MAVPTPLSSQMNRVLLQLELVSNGTVARMGGSSGGGSARHYDSSTAPTLGLHDAPHIYWRRRWNEAPDDFTRELVLDLAVEELDGIRRSAVDPRTVGETLDELMARIVERAQLGFTRREVAVSFHTSESIVARAWRDAGLDEQTGAPLVSLAGLPADVRRARVREYAATHSGNAKAIARTLGLKYSTVLRDLDRKT